MDKRKSRAAEVTFRPARQLSEAVPASGDKRKIHVSVRQICMKAIAKSALFRSHRFALEIPHRATCVRPIRDSDQAAGSGWWKVRSMRRSPSNLSSPYHMRSYCNSSAIRAASLSFWGLEVLEPDGAVLSVEIVAAIERHNRAPHRIWEEADLIDGDKSVRYCSRRSFDSTPCLTGSSRTWRSRPGYDGAPITKGFTRKARHRSR
jgi:hypothetical protein